MTDFFIADTHFFHDAVAAHRGFQTTEQHNRTIIDNIVHATRPGDTIFFVGDVVGRTDDAEAALELIDHNLHNRTLRLISGNHDPVHTHATDPVSISDNGTIQICVSADAWDMGAGE